MSLFILIIAITALVSFLAFSDNRLMDKLILWPARMHEPVQYYRLLTSGFIHADWTHLLFNMISLYFVGEFAFYVLGKWFLLLYLAGIVVASLPSFLKNRNNYYYRSLGASGGVSAVMFFFIYFLPWQKIYLMFLPGLGIPAILFGVLYLASEVFMSRRSESNINHDAHIWGAVFGVVFALIKDPTHGGYLIHTLTNPVF